MKRRFSLVVLVALCVLLVCPFSSVYAETIDKHSAVSDEMCKASYWYDKGLGDADALLMTSDEIDAWNEQTRADEGTGVFDISDENIVKASYDPSKNLNTLSKYDPFEHKSILCYKGITYSRADFVSNIQKAIAETGYTSSTKETEYAVVVKMTKLRQLPASSDIGYYLSDPDDENSLDLLEVNQPVVIRQTATFDEEKFYYVATNNLNGWVPAEDIAICKDRAEWLDSWQVETGAKDFIVVTQDRIVLEKSHMYPEVSGVEISMGTVLKLVADEDKPETVTGRSTWNNYVVYLPTRNENGEYVKSMALISQHNSVSVGFLPYTQKNVIKLLFETLGDRYGWGGTDYSDDCSMHTYTINSCFGFQMPRNTTMQMAVTTGHIVMEKFTSEERYKLLATSPIGTIGLWDGHSFIYSGSTNNLNYTVSSVGIINESEGELSTLTTNSIILNAMNARRNTGLTWLDSIEYLSLPTGFLDLSKCTYNVTEKGVELAYCGVKLYEGVNYTLRFDQASKTYVATGINNYQGTLTLKPHKLTGIKVTKKLYYNGEKQQIQFAVTSTGQTYTAANDNLFIIGNTATKPGTYTVSAVGRGNLKGSVSAEYKVRIKPTSFTKAIKSKKLIATAKKLSKKYVDGYQFRYSKNADMTCATKTKASKSNKLTLKLTNSKNYYVQVRTFKTVGKTKYYSKWSVVI